MQIRISHRAGNGPDIHETCIELDALGPRLHVVGEPAPAAVLDTVEASDRLIRIAADGSRLAADDTTTLHVAVLDEAAGLMWSIASMGEPSDESDSITYDTAAKRCADLDLLGHRDWRLPTRAELIGLIDDTRHEPAIDTALFPGVLPRWHWTSTPCAWSSSAAWGVNFSHGLVHYGPRDYNGFALAVRSVRRPGQ